MPPDVDPTMDRQRMREIGRRLADAYLEDPPLLTFNTVSEPPVDDDFTGATAMEVS